MFQRTQSKGIKFSVSRIKQYLTSLPEPGRKLLTVMVRPGAGKGASMTLCMKGWTKAGEISLLLSTSSKIYSQTFQVVTLQRLSKRFSADKAGNSYLISEMPLTFENRLKQPSLLMMQWTSGSLFPFPLGCRTHKSKVKVSVYLPLRIHNILSLCIIYSPSYCTKPTRWFMWRLEWHDECARLAKELRCLGEILFFCWINMNIYKLTRILRQYPNKRLPSSPVRTKENVSLRVIIKDHIRRMN